MIGNSMVTSICGYVPWTTISDGRVKKNIRTDVPGLAFINQLEPVTYNLDLDAADKITRTGKSALDSRQNDASTGEATNEADTAQFSPVPGGDAPVQLRSAEIPPVDTKARAERQKRIQTGFVAQDVEKAAQSIGYEFSGVDVPENDNSLYGLRYSEFIVPLVKSVQELSAQNDSLKQQNDSLAQRIDRLEALVNKLIDGKQVEKEVSPYPAQRSLSYPDASLEQNFPNPYNYITTIRYTLPQTFGSAKIVITSTSGVMVMQKQLAGSGGAGQITVEAGSLSVGVYFYSLIVDGTLIDTKKMIIS
jgi:hypothetical protein